jgi:ribulose-phosphate 3-epimerase
MPLVAPALVSADFARLGEALEQFQAAGTRIIHIDVADGHFVPDLTLGQSVIAKVRRVTDLQLDLHLLVERPERYITDFVKAGADRICVHAEATAQVYSALDLIRKQGVQAGLALNPATAVSSVVDILSEVSYLNILCADLAVEAGVREQSFMSGAAQKIRTAAEIRDARRLDFDIQVEGGIGPLNIGRLIEAGADILVAGSAIFQDGNPKSQLGRMIRLAAETPGRRTI